MNRPFSTDVSSARSPQGIALLALVLLAQAAMALSAVLGQGTAFYVAAAVSLGADVAAQQVTAVRTLLGRAQLGYVNRAVLRELGLLVLVARLGILGPRGVPPARAGGHGDTGHAQHAPAAARAPGAPPAAPGGGAQPRAA